MQPVRRRNDVHRRDLVVGGQPPRAHMPCPSCGARHYLVVESGAYDLTAEEHDKDEGLEGE